MRGPADVANLLMGRKTANPRQGTKTLDSRLSQCGATCGVGRQPILARGLRHTVTLYRLAVVLACRKTANPRQGTKTISPSASAWLHRLLRRKTANPRQGTKTQQQRLCHHGACQVWRVGRQPILARGLRRLSPNAVPPPWIVGRQPILARGLRQFIVAAVFSHPQTVAMQGRKTANPRQGTKTLQYVCK